MAIVNDLIQQRARRAVQVIAQQAPVRAAYLFGSQVEGTADEFSDIDIAAFVDGAGQWDLRRRVRAGADVQKQAGDDIEIHFFPSELLENPPAASFAKYVQNHGVLVEIRTRP